ncbi:MAG: DUF2330 domain-containing protein [Myxococcales bacterium]|nr:DUF2330 domain-containing protein [Myxococcales bacterium]
MTYSPLFARARLLAPAAAALVAGLTLTSAPQEAAACGGLFCDGGMPMPVPVDQTGENVLFIVDEQEGTVEAHIQIQYMGDPDKFAWVIPVQSEPDFSAGSELLFTNLLAGTVPTYSFTNTFDCQDKSGPSLGCAYAEADFAGDSGEGFGSASAGGTDGGDPGPQIIKREIVGAFEIVVLKGGNAQELYDWLDTHGYAQDPDAPPILEEYLSEGYYFAAAKLVHGAGVDELQPLVMTYKGNQPCVPLRLTRIAAVEDMPIRVFALGVERAVPLVYKHVVLNETILDWVNSASDYYAAVAQAIDEAEMGQGFVTEYAGPSSVVSSGGLYSDRWETVDFVGAIPVNGSYTIVDALTSIGLMECFSGFEGAEGCSYNHPLLLPILRTYLPAPAGVQEDTFYECMECFEAMIDYGAWDSAKFAADLDERIIAPGKHARDLLTRWPYVTRMLTIMSPHEMTRDPEFTYNPDLDDVVASHSATQMIPCEGSNKFVFADGRELLLDPSGSWPDLGDMPAAERVEVMTPAGAPQVEVDNKEAIDDAIRASNKRFDYDNGEGVNCAVRSLRSSLMGTLSLAFVFGFAWRGRRRRARG